MLQKVDGKSSASARINIPTTTHGTRVVIYATAPNSHPFGSAIAAIHGTPRQNWLRLLCVRVCVCVRGCLSACLPASGLLVYLFCFVAFIFK